jgi:hypothetical protein
LPVTSLDLKGSLVNGNTLLTWNTKSEINNKGFEVQKSADANTFANIGFVNGNGTTNAAHNYYFTDNTVTGSLNYYRLQQIDLNGHFSYSNIITITKANADTVSVRQNPFQSQLSFVLNGSNIAGNVSINVFDAAGKEVYSSAQPAQNVINISGANWPAGIYIASAIWNNKRYTFKVIKK